MALAAMLVVTSFVFAKNDRKARRLEVLWEKYEDAQDEDRIQDMIDILGDIKSVAGRNKASWDFLRASEEYVNANLYRNWKLRDSVILKTAGEIRAYGNPLLEIMFSMEHGARADSLLKMLEADEKRLKAAVTRDVYEGSGVFGDEDLDELMAGIVRDDYEFALWTLMLHRANDCGWASDALDDCLEGRYPSVPLVRYIEAKRINEHSGRMKAMERLAGEYAGTAMGMVAEDEIMYLRFDGMREKASSDEYRALEKDLVDFGKKVDALKGDEEVLAEAFCRSWRILSELRGRDAAVLVEDGRGRVILKNMDKVRFRIQGLPDEKIVFDTMVANEKGSFYVPDTLVVEVPDFADGDYVLVLLEGKDAVYHASYPKHTVSLAQRTAADGPAFYAADYMTGEPVAKADLVISDRFMRKIAELKDFVFDGFTGIPEGTVDFDEDKTYYVSCRYHEDGLLRISSPLRVNFRNGPYVQNPTSISANVMTDRGAYMPGDTVQFKAVVYENMEGDVMRTLPEGAEIEVTLQNNLAEVVARKVLTTNEFGSVAGSFAINKGHRNGGWRLMFFYEGRSVGSRFFTVDEFVLPSYDVAFLPLEGLHVPGDTVTVKGMVKNFSGHGFFGLEAEAAVRVDGREMQLMPVEISGDGSFAVSFKAGTGKERYVGYNVILRLVDRTGEILEFGCTGYVSARMSIRNESLDRDYGKFGIKEQQTRSYLYELTNLFSGGTVKIKVWVDAGESDKVDAPVDYRLMHEGKVVSEGRVMSGDTLSLDMSKMKSGLYEIEQKALVTSASGWLGEVEESYRLLYLRKDETELPDDVDWMFRAVDNGDNVCVQFGSGTGPLWGVVSAFGEGAVPLRQDVVRAGGIAEVSCPFPDNGMDEVLVQIFCFRSGHALEFGHSFRRPEAKADFPLEFSSFVDKALPGQECRIVLKAAPDAEAVAAVYDMSSDEIRRNVWETVRGEKDGIDVRTGFSIGSDRGGSDYFFDDVVVTAYGSARNAKMSRAVGSVESADMLSDNVSVEEEAAAAVEVRDDFGTTLAFEPFLRPSEDGTLELGFRTSDKLSTFKMMVYAHDKSMNNSLVSRELLVTLPLKVSVAPPQYLYEGDRYVLNASVSNSSPAPFKGRLSLEVFGGAGYSGMEPLTVESVEVEAAPGCASDAGFEVNVPEGVDTLGFKVVFVGHECASEGVAMNDVLISDGVFVPVPVYPAAQVLTEAHSGVLLGGQSADELVERLGDEFVNVSSVGAECEEISIMDMVKEAFPGAVHVEENDAVSLADGLYVNLLAYGLNGGGYGVSGEDDAEAGACVDEAMDSMKRLLKCADEDGGFAWFEGMKSSPVVTAVVLGRYADLRDGEKLDFLSELMDEDVLDDFDEAVVKAVRYLDSSYFGDRDRPFWYGRISLEQYLDVRSRFAGVSFDKTSAKKSGTYKEFRKAVRSYLTGKGGQGGILSKVRRVGIIDRLTADYGAGLAKAWGAGSERRLLKVRKTDVESLKQYAVVHPSGGVYYPNAVMPWRGLLESEAYAHARIADLALSLALAGEDPQWAAVSDGIRIWIMLQKETQDWSAEPGFVDALASVMDGGPEVKDTRVVVLKKRYMKPFDEIKAAGNGFKVSVDYYREDRGGERVRLSDGDSVRVGEKITAVYSIWSQENRSHVRLSVPRAACFRPADQLSGWSGGWFRPLSYGFMNVSPYSYREVRADRTLWWIDVFPEEDTTIEETLFVTQEGVFTAPAAEIESVYAPHYRANDTWSGILEISK